MAKKRKKKKIELTPQEKGARTRRRYRIMLTIASILFIDFLLSTLNLMLVKVEDQVSPYLLTIIGMILVVLLFFPALFFENFVNRSTEWMIKRTMDIGASVLGRNFGKKTGVYAVFGFLLFVMYFGLYWAWFEKLPFFG